MRVEIEILVRRPGQGSESVGSHEAELGDEFVMLPTRLIDRAAHRLGGLRSADDQLVIWIKEVKP